MYFCVCALLLQVTWAEQQVAKRRKKRDVYVEPFDPKFRDQWYLVSMTNAEQELHWTKGYMCVLCVSVGQDSALHAG